MKKRIKLMRKKNLPLPTRIKQGASQYFLCFQLKMEQNMFEYSIILSIFGLFIYSIHKALPIAPEHPKIATFKFVIG